MIFLKRIVPLAALALLAIPVVQGCGDSPAGRTSDEDFEATAFFERVEGEVRERGPELREKNLEHYALLTPVDEADIARWIAPISARRDGARIVLAVGDVPELHGGAILDFLFRHWRPKGRAARAGDRFPFRNGEVALADIYAGHRLQVYLPDSPGLARMRFFAETDGVAVVERDAYSFLHLLIAREVDFSVKWRNGLNQELSVDALMHQAWSHYLRGRSAEDERVDHSNLHLVELLLAYRYRAQTRSNNFGGLDPNEIKQSFLENELARSPSDSDDEALAHYVESLGWLLAEPDVSWNEAEERQVRDWLRWLEEERFRELEAAEAPHLAHLHNGLRLVDAHRERLTGR